MGDARKCNTCTQLDHVTCTPHNFGVLCKSWCRERTMRDGLSGLLTHESSIPSFPNEQIVKCQNLLWLKIYAVKAAPFVLFVTLRVTAGHFTMSAVTLARGRWALSASWTARSRHILSWRAWGAYHQGAEIADKTYDVFKPVFVKHRPIKMMHRAFDLTLTWFLSTSAHCTMCRDEATPAGTTEWKKKVWRYGAYPCVSMLISCLVTFHLVIGNWR